MSFTITLDDNSVHEVSQFVFNDGSVQVEISGDLPLHAESAIILAYLQTPEDQMALIMLSNAIRIACPVVKIHCLMQFTPYGRQDAPFCKGQANSMKAWADVVNSLGFASVTVTDPHSIAVSHLDNCISIDIVELIHMSKFLTNLITSGDMTLVSPDAGSNKKAHNIAKEFGFTKLIRADKARNLATGEIVETEVYGDVSGDTCLIVDDICDGGMTFIKLAEALRDKGAEKVILLVTHGLFTKGLGVFEDLIDEIYTTSSWPRKSHDNDSTYTGIYKVLD